MTKKQKRKQEDKETSRNVETLSNKKILKNIRIYSRDGPIVEEEQASSVKRYIPQFLANFAINLLMADTGLALSYPTLVIGYIYSENGTHRNMEDNFLHLDLFKHFTMDKVQSSVYSGFQYLSIPFGCIAGGCIIDKIGRKKVMLLASVPLFMFWLMNFLSQDVAMLYLANLFSGFGIGLGESAIATYQGEVTEPSIRGTIINFAIVWLSVSLLIPYILHLGIASWRWISLIFSLMPIVAGIVSLIVPESPTWLLSKGQVTLGERSLVRLRGGATKKEIVQEMQEIMTYHNSAAILYNRHPAVATSTDRLLSKKRFQEEWNHFKSDRMRKPLVLSCVLFALIYLTGMSVMRPYLNPVLAKLHYNGHWTTIGLTITLTGVLGNILAVLVVRVTGKRQLVISALLVNGIATLVAAVAIIKRLSMLVKLTAIHLISLASGYGIVPIPWMLQSEIYPFRGRGMAASIAAGISYIMGFIATVIFLPLVDSITLEAVFFIFSFFSFIGIIYLYFKMPETEGRTLQQVELFFSGALK